MEHWGKRVKVKFHFYKALKPECTFLGESKFGLAYKFFKNATSLALLLKWETLGPVMALFMTNIISNDLERKTFNNRHCK